MASYQYVFVMKGLTKIYPGGKKVLDNVWLSFYPGAKIGVLGPNGAGKSTLMKIMAGMDKDFNGEAWTAEGATVGYLSQEPQLDESKTVQENVMEALAGTKALLDRFEEVSMKLGEVEDPDEMTALIDEQAELQEKIEAADAWDLQRTVEIAMDALRCPPADSARHQAVGRRAPPRGAVQAAAPEARPAAAGRADQPSGRRIGGLAGAVPAGLQGHRRRWSPTTATSWTT